MITEVEILIVLIFLIINFKFFFCCILTNSKLGLYHSSHNEISTKVCSCHTIKKSSLKSTPCRCNRDNKFCQFTKKYSMNLKSSFHSKFKFIYLLVNNITVNQHPMSCRFWHCLKMDTRW